ncbi:hypothetical protein [Dactylosporangium matsuzakiense]|uniref:Uncharacterized protein n=1 Tax=Dactylosporangium matsuzakiense TaxID=53360 RepID=A0A9W6NPQ4_9ACTN|nr:hypothetical protein [Dactylosporangium matsuzakiense]UWZ44587.1 hypothetical protein Dmats_45830 [Dactylosporangium matsuzakiense]GLL05350.1 hypothetical protein GCM10017581_070970 [Dactylosporangium matsuzakiense]
MSDLHETSLSDFLAVDEERRESERVNGVPESYSGWPRDLLMRRRAALAQLRLVRSVTRHQGRQPPALDAGLSWVDERWFELKVDGDSGIAFYLQTPEPA